METERDGVGTKLLVLLGAEHADPPAVDLPLLQLSEKRYPESGPFCRTT